MRLDLHLPMGFQQHFAFSTKCDVRSSERLSSLTLGGYDCRLECVPVECFACQQLEEDQNWPKAREELQIQL